MVIAVDQPQRTHRSVAGSARVASHPFVFPQAPSASFIERVRGTIRPELSSRRLLVAALFAAAAAGMLSFFTSGTVNAEISTAASVLGGGDGSEIGEYLRSFGAWGPIVSLSLMLLQAVVAPIPGSLIGLANGLAYGVFWGGMLTLGGQTLAAAACFVIARHVGRARVESLSGKAAEVAGSGWLARWGAAGIILTRLIPGVSFDLISFAAGLTRMGFGRFLIATVIGSAPQAFLASYLVQRSPMLGWAFMGISVAAMGGIALFALIRRRAAAQTA